MTSSTNDSGKGKVVSFLLRLLSESIILIIGILLALQINAWAEERAQTTTLNNDLHYVLEDLNNNKAELEKINEQKKESIQACTELLDAYKQGDSLTSEHMIETLSGILKTNKYNSDNSGFEKIKTSPLYESEEFYVVRDKIRTYNELLEDLRFTESFINSYITSLSMEMSMNGILVVVFDYIRMKEGVAQFEGEPLDFTVSDILDNNNPLLAVLHKYEFDAPRLTEDYSELLAAGEELRSVIKTYLEE